MRKMLEFIIVCGGIYILVMAGMYAMQRKIMYQPSTEISVPAHYGTPNAQQVQLIPSDNNETMAWWLPGQPGKPVIIYFHGNAGHLGDRAVKFRAWNDAGYPVLAVSYRGYGSSKGQPTEQGLYMDARAALLYARAKLGFDEQHVILYGESLGTGVAVQMATEHAVGGMVLEAPYLSVTKRSEELYPFLPVRWLLKDKFESLHKITSVKAPLLVLHGKMDIVIPYHHGKELLSMANQPKRGVFYELVGHTDFALDELVRQMDQFTAEHQLQR